VSIIGRRMVTASRRARPGSQALDSPGRTPGSVLLVTPSWTRDGGVEAHVKASAAALAQSGLRVSVLAGRVAQDRQTEALSIFHAPSLFDADAAPHERIGEAARSEPEVVHFHQVYAPELIDFLRERAPVVVSAHSYGACPSGVYYFRPGRECTRAHGLGCIPRMLARGCMHARDPRELPGKYVRAGRALEAFRRADLAVAYSSAVDRHLEANGVRRRAIVPLFTTMAPLTGAGHSDRRRVVFAGRVVQPKGAEVLIRAAVEVDAEFVICGEGRQLPALRALARRLGIEQQVSFRGWLPASELARELADASVVAIPSLWPEPFGLVGIEALSAGRPVVASDTGGVSDWLQDGVSGLLVPPGEARALARALNELLSDPERQRAMGAAGRDTVAERFSREQHVQALVAAYGAARSTWRLEHGAPV
jgi:glycosyltransferase involved in cell wall biosynthesis